MFLAMVFLWYGFVFGFRFAIGFGFQVTLELRKMAQRLLGLCGFAALTFFLR
jgi:hypothetical protein